MADRAQPKVSNRTSATTLFGGLSVALVLFLTVGTLAAVVMRADALNGLGRSDWAAIRFTLLQAALSVGISVLLAIPVARALARQRFWGRRALITLLGAPFILPVIVAVLGLIAVFGRSGVVSQALGLFGFEPLSIYGVHGVVLAHVFFNLPLATRLILQGWATIPVEQLRLAASLGFGPAELRRHVEWPMLRGILPGITLVIFLICVTSFAVALTLGGGPRATTVELAIYQAFRFEFDLGQAALLSGVQFAICALAAALAFGATGWTDQAPGLDIPPLPLQPSRIQRAADTAWIGAAALFLIAPLLAVMLRGAPAVLDLPASVFAALGRSVAVALAATAVTMFLSLSIAAWTVRARRFGSWIEGCGYLAITASPLVIGTGLFILLFPVADPTALSLPITCLVNAAMALPFALRSLVPPMRQVERDLGPLAASLGMSGPARLRLVVLPRLRRPLGFAAGLTAALSMGDLGVIAMFADPDKATLPMQIYQLMGAYRMDLAAAASTLLVAAAVLMFFAFDLRGRGDAAS